MKQKQPKPFMFDEDDLRKELLTSARAVGISVAVAEVISTKIASRVAERVSKRTVIAMNDLNRLIAEEANKYSQDLAYVYQNRDKII